MSANDDQAKTAPKALLNAVHHLAVHNRRVRILAHHLAEIIPEGGRVLDVGCGDGLISRAIMDQRPDLEIEGVDVMLRPTTHIPATKFDGTTLPFADDSFDYVTIVDVLHHTSDPVIMLAESCRVARKGVVLKDHLREGFGSRATLRLMDWVGNRGHDVVLPYNYLSRSEWDAAFARARLRIATWCGELGLYPPPARYLFDRHLHFIALLAPDRLTQASRAM
ncbi:MAG: class I SAM-dependent methyltransferase [Gemmatimonadales bacterium]|jgi:SAM-dependent methyltransferase